MRTKMISYVICAIMIVTVFVIEVPKDASAQVIEEWVARYDGPGNMYDQGRAIALDPQGNIYVSGYSYDNATSTDYTTIKYDPDGNVLWVARYNGPVNGADSVMAMTTDSQGNVYTTGGSYGGGTYKDYATVKYDTDGNELWVARYTTPRDEVAQAIAVDHSGNVYVTGWSGIGGGIDYATVAYDPFGNQLWTATYNGPADGIDYGREIAVDSQGNVFVTGDSLGNGMHMDYVTIAYDKSGNELWTAKYDGPEGSNDLVYDIVLDTSSNIYITGISGCDYVTIKYDIDGNELWIARYDGPGNSIDEPKAITMDVSGNIYVTGGSHGSGTGYDFATVAYDTSGYLLWVARYNDPTNINEVANAIAIDSSQNLYVTGYSSDNTPVYYIVTIAYDSLGNELWVAKYNDSEMGFDYAYDIVADSYGNVYVTGYSIIGILNYDCITIKYSQKLILEATINIDPDTLNLKSKGRWITCYIDLPGYDLNDIDISTILLEDTIPAEWGDIQGDTLMVKFDRSDVEDMLSPGTYNLKVTGELTDGTYFEGYSDEIRIIDPGK